MYIQHTKKNTGSIPSGWREEWVQQRNHGETNDAIIIKWQSFTKNTNDNAELNIMATINSHISITCKYQCLQFFKKIQTELNTSICCL